MSDIRKAVIVTNFNRDPDLSKTKQIIKILDDNGIEVLPPQADTLNKRNSSSEEMGFDNADLILTLGGDGTILSVAEKAAASHIPVMGVNIGNLGYLTDCSFEEAEKAIELLISGNYVRQKRIMLKAQVISETTRSQPKRCLNDVCIARGATSKIIRFDLLINDNFVDNYNADGIIISTPTGSTAYNLAAGGPILIPHSEMIAITPVCPHMLTTRPIVVMSGDKITISIGATKKETMMTLDGREPVLLNNGDIVNIERAESCVEIIKTNSLDFYDILRKKLIYAGAVDL